MKRKAILILTSILLCIGLVLGCEPSEDEHNIAIGPGAGKDLTTETHQFCLVIEDTEYRTTLTKSEWRVINPVIKRMIDRPWHTKNLSVGASSSHDITTGSTSGPFGEH